MDFITDLPLSKDPATNVFYDTILVMVDKLTKYTHFIPCHKTINAPQLGYLVLDRLVRHHGLPLSFITDRDKLFTSAYWKTLTAAMGIKHKLSTAFHPESDGQTERANQTLEAYLRHYLSHTQDNWVTLLPMAQLAINDNVSETTKVTPFFGNYGKNPNLFRTPLVNPGAANALLEAEKMKTLHQHILQNTKNEQYRITKSRHKPNKNGPQLKKGDKVYLLTKNMKTKRPTKKLDHVKVGPFLIAEQKGPVNYRLELPPDARIHPVFHVSLLEPANPDTPLQTTFHFEPQEDDVFEVDKIIKFDGTKYLVHWKGYDTSEDTWEPPENMLTCLEDLASFHHNPTLTADFPIAGHWHVDTSNRRTFLRSFPVQPVTGRCPKCNPRPRGRPGKH
jgi:hypothetical protein